MHILVSAATASDLAETAEQSIDYLQSTHFCQCDDHSYHWMVFDQVCL